MAEELKQGFLLHYDARVMLGVSKKIDMQLHELRKYASVEEICIKLKTKSMVINALAVLPFMSLSWDYEEAYKRIKEVDFIYVRSISYDYITYRFVKWVKKNNKNCKIVVEIPTYPLRAECFQSIQGIVLYPKQIWNRMRMAKYIDRYVVYTNVEYAYGVKTIYTQNGIDVDSIKPISGEVNNGDIILIAVAYMQKYHGYDRLLNGLASYYSNNPSRKVFVKLIGDGPELETYRDIVANSNLSSYVSFEGNKTGKDLDEAYDQADLAVGSLGGYRIGINLFSSLKTREYLAKGLPIISGAPIDVLVEKGREYCLEFPNDDTPIDIEKVVEYYDKVYLNSTRKEVAQNIHEFAKENVDMSAVMKPIVNFVNC